MTLKGANMTITFKNFIIEMFTNPGFFVISALVLGVLFVNGMVDAPNSIATCVSTRSISPKKALVVSAVSSFLGMLIMTMISATVANTIYNLVSFGNNTTHGIILVIAALFSIVLWSTLAAKLSIPSSQSHALVAGLTGSSIAILNGFSGINFDEWKKVIYGLVISIILGFVLGFIISKIIEMICKNKDRRKTTPFFRKTSVLSGAINSFMNGAQDGQKFIGILLLGLALCSGNYGETPQIPVWLMLVCSLTMTLGTAVGGLRVIKTIGTRLVKLEAYQGTAADLASSTCLLISTVFGVPISTTHTSTTAMMGVGASRNIKKVNWEIFKKMIKAWVFTFPGCGLVGYIITKILLSIFV